MTHVTCRLTAKSRDQLRNPTLGNRVWATFLFFTFYPSFCESTALLLRVRYCRVCVCVCVCVAVPEMPRNVSVVNETRTTVSVTASLPRRGTMQSDTSATLPVSSWHIHYVHHASTTDPAADQLSRVATFNTSTTPVVGWIGWSRV